MKVSIKTVALLLATPLLAWWSASAAIGNINKLDRPELALAAWPVNGFAAATQSYGALRDRVLDAKGQVNARDVTPAMQRLAVTAFINEPVTPQALGVLGLSYDARNPEKARKIMRLANGLSRRDPLVNGWLLRDYARLNDVPRTFRHMGYAAVTRPETQDVYIPALVKALANADAVPVLAPFLASEPPWRGLFWDLARQDAAALPGAIALRRTLAGKQYGMTDIAVSDRSLLSAALSAGLNSEAAALANDLWAANGGKLPAANRLNLLRNGGFAGAEGLPPFDWTVTSRAEYGGYIDEGRGILEISALSGVGGAVASQMVALEPGRYRLTATLDGAPGTTTPDVVVRLSCAEAGTVNDYVAPLKLEKTVNRGDIEIKREGCRWFNATVEIVAGSARTDASLMLTELSITRL